MRTAPKLGGNTSSERDEIALKDDYLRVLCNQNGVYENAFAIRAVTDRGAITRAVQSLILSLPHLAINFDSPLEKDAFHGPPVMFSDSQSHQENYNFPVFSQNVLSKDNCV